MRRNILYKPILKDRAKDLRNNMTRAEKKLWYEFLKSSSYRFLRQKPIGNYIVDFYCPKLKLAIEVDGETHIIDNGPEYDKNRTVELEKNGINVLRFYNNEIYHSLELVKERIEESIEEIILKRA